MGKNKRTVCQRFYTITNVLIIIIFLTNLMKLTKLPIVIKLVWIRTKWCFGQNQVGVACLLTP